MTTTRYYGAILVLPMDNWPEAVVQYQDSGWEFFQIENAKEATQHNPNLLHSSKRHWVDHQDPYLYASDKDQAARDYLATHIDGTFDANMFITLPDGTQVATVHHDNDLNEYYGGEPPEQREEKIAWSRAIAKVFALEYRSQQKYEHLRLILARTAVGNDIPIEVAEAAQQYDCILSYHGYTPVKNGVILGHGSQLRTYGRRGYYVAEQSSFRGQNRYLVRFQPISAMDITTSEDVASKYFAHRFAEMDRNYKANGIEVDWCLTECGPVGYSENANGIHLHAFDGWRHPDVCNGNMQNLLDILQWNAQFYYDWNKENNDRFKFARLFASDRLGWPYFYYDTDNLKSVAQWQNAWVPDGGVEPPPDPDVEVLFLDEFPQTSNENQLIQNPIWDDGHYHPTNTQLASDGYYDVLVGSGSGIPEFQLANAWSIRYRDNYVQQTPPGADPGHPSAPPECRVLPASQLPAEEHGTLVIHDNTVKVFSSAGGRTLDAIYQTRITPKHAGKIHVVFDLVPDLLMSWNPKVYAPDPLSGQIRFWLNGQPVSNWESVCDWEVVEQGANQYRGIAFTVEDTTPQLIGIEMMTVWAIPGQNYFIPQTTAYHAGDDPPPPVNDRARMLALAKENQVITPIAGAALGKSIQEAGHQWLSNEFQYQYHSSGVLYVCQYAYDIANPDDCYVHKVPYGQWDQVTIEYYPNCQADDRDNIPF